MNSRPLLSVVSASWNQGKYVEECIKSVRPSHAGEVEHIVIDNCSDDETAEVLASHPELRTLVEQDRGQSEALNKGFRMAQGEWILWLNVDDYLLPGVIDRYLEEIKRGGENFDLLYGHMVFVGPNGKKVKTVYQPQWRYWMTTFGGFVAPSTGSVYRRSTLLEDPLDEDFHIIMDTEWMLRAGRSVRARRLKMETVSFRVGVNKTAQHITDGTLSPQHARERELLGQRYPGYPGAPRADWGLVPKLVARAKRLLVRGVVIVEKQLLRLHAKRS